MTPADDASHPDVAALVHYRLGRLADRDHEAVARHLASCPECWKRYEASRHTFDIVLSVDLSIAAREVDDLPFADEIGEEA